MIYQIQGKVVKGLGGLYEIRAVENGEPRRFSCRAKGALHREEAKVLVGDNVELKIDDATPDSVVISQICERKNALIRPPMANLDILFIVLATIKPSPVLETVDKLLAIAEHSSIRPVLVITKADLDEDSAREYADIYTLAGYPVFVTSSNTGEGIDAVKAFIDKEIRSGITAAFAGASGVGKSTLLNALFPTLSLATAEISHKIERGKHTTRHVELYAISPENSDTGYLADTPGFSLIDFERFHFFALEELFSTFPDFAPFVGKCQYADCAHVGESARECAIARAAEEGKIAPTRLSSYRSIYRVLKSKNEYK